MAHRRIVLSAFAAILVLLLDRVSKISALRHLSENHSVPVLDPWLQWTLHRNTGAAFGLGAQAPAVLAAFAAVLTLGLLIWWIRVSAAPRRAVESFALALILGGSAGNLFDRYTLGAVIDFIDVKVWPIFNVADIAITSGAVLWIGAVILKRGNGVR